MKQTQIGKLKIPNIYGTIKIFQTEDRYNPYRIYHEYNELTEHGIQKPGAVKIYNLFIKTY